MSVSDLGINPRLGSKDVAFERICQMGCRQIVEWKGLGTATDSDPLSRSHDGGAEVIVWTDAGHTVALQAKAYNDFKGEKASIKASFDTLLKNPNHAGVTHYLWCSTFDRDAGPRRKAINKTIGEMRKMANGRPITVQFVGLGNIRAALRGDLHQLCFQQAVIPPENFKMLTDSALDAALERVPGDIGTVLHFESELDDVLRTFTTLNTTDSLDVSRLAVYATELDRRLRECDHPPSAVVDAHARISPIISHLQSNPVADLDITRMDLVIEALVTAARQLHHRLNELDAGGDDSALHGQLRSVGVSVVVIRYELHELKTMADALRSRVLVVAGQWGTGKTYHLARHIRALSLADTPVLFVRAKSFRSRDTPLLMQSWRQGLGGSELGTDGLLGVLDILAPKDRWSILAVDGLNEWAYAADPVGELQRVAEKLNRFAHVKLVVTIRSSRKNTDHDLPQHWHEGPAREDMAQVLTTHFRLPVVAYWSAALQNPLTARIAAYVAKNNPQQAQSILSPISLSDLFRQWVTLLAIEYAREEPGRSAAAVTALLDALSAFPGRATRRQLIAEAGGTETTHSIIDYLITHGCFEEIGGDITFRLQRMSELARAHHLVQNGPERAAQELAEMPPPDHDNYLRLLADETPISTKPPAELPDWLPDYPDDLQVYFAQSLQTRANNRYSTRTLSLAAQALLTPQLSAYICYAALINPLGCSQSVSPAWFADQLTQMTTQQRATIWPDALDECLREESSERLFRNDQYTGALSAIVTWTSTEIAEWPQAQQLGMARILLWFSWAGGRLNNPVYAYAVRQLCELLHANPALASDLAADCDATRDEYLCEALTAATLAVMLRWPEEPGSQQVGQIIWEAMARLRPQMFRTLEFLYRIGRQLKDEVAEFRVFLYAAENHIQPTPQEIEDTLEQSPQILHDGITALFADGQLPHQYAAHERALVRACAPHTCADKLEDLLTQRWLTHQHARYKIGGRISTSVTGPIKAGTEGNPALGYVECGELSGQTDPTLPLSLSIRYSSQVRGQWWIVNPHPRALTDITVTDPDGDNWIVLDGSFDWLEPPTPSHRELIWLTNVAGGRQRRPDVGLPSPGQRARHRLILHTVFEGAPTDNEASDTGGGALFADQLRWPSDAQQHWTATAQHNEGGPDPALAMLLSARWTGNNLDYCHHNTLVITDPALRERTGPRALLVRAAPFMRALRAHNISATVRVDPRDPRTLPRRSAPEHTIMIAAHDSSQGPLGPSTQ